MSAELIDYKKLPMKPCRKLFRLNMAADYRGWEPFSLDGAVVLSGFLANQRHRILLTKPVPLVSYSDEKK
jgi:hypothetical protein